jgi:Protein kinase domain/S-layer homology domain
MADQLLNRILDGRYRIVSLLGEGGFGKTYVAEDTRRPGSPRCVVKQLRLDSDDAALLDIARRLFNTEAETLQKLGRHPQIPDLLAYFEEVQEFFLVEELIPGTPLTKELIPERPLPESRVLEILTDVLEVLAFVHANGVIHRDIKPDNLICRSDTGRLVLIDFGAVKSIGTQLTSMRSETAGATVAIGTPGYMPGEQAAGAPRFASDIYALGMVCVHALAGIAPVELKFDPRSSELLWPEGLRTNDALRLILLKMVRSHNSERYQSVEQVQTDLEKIAEANEAAVVLRRRAETLANAASNLAKNTGHQIATTAAAYKDPAKEVLKKGSAASARAGLFVLGATGRMVARAGRSFWQWSAAQLARIPAPVRWLGGTAVVLAGGAYLFVGLNPIRGPALGGATAPNLGAIVRGVRQAFNSAPVRVTAKDGFGNNLLVNGNAEAGDGSATGFDLVFVPGWATVGNLTVVDYDIPKDGFLKHSHTLPPDSADRYFAGGPGGDVTTATQIIDLAAVAPTIDSGAVGYTLSGSLGGPSNGDSQASLKATFRDAVGKNLAVAAVPPASSSDRRYQAGLIHRSVFGEIPIGTRTVEVRLQLADDEKTYNRAYADSLSFVLSPPPFDDLAGAFGGKEIAQLAALEVFGQTGVAFSPQRPVTRAEFVRWLVRANNALFAETPTKRIRLAEGGGLVSFADVPENHPDFEYIQGMMNAGIAIGVNDTEFRPNDPLTREQMIAIKVGIDLKGDLKNSDVDYIPNWSDKDKISPYFKGALNVEYRSNTRVRNVERVYGVIKTFRPQQAVTRAEGVVCMWQIGNGYEPRTAAAALDALRQDKQ